MQWTEGAERLVETWRERAHICAAEHERAAKWCKRRHARWALPAALIPAALIPVMATVDVGPSLWLGYAEALALLVAGSCSVVSNFFGFAAMAEKHHAFAARYVDVVTEIDAETAKVVALRGSCDVFMVRVQMLLDSLNRDAPDL